MKRIPTLFLSLMLTLILVMSFPISALAASFELSATAKGSFDTMVASTNATSANLLNNRYADILNLQQQSQDWDTKIKDLHATNEGGLVAIKQQIQFVDSEKLATLQTQLTEARNRYEPLFNMYESLNQQKAAAKKLSNKTYYNLLQTQTENMKIAVQLARTDIRNKVSIHTTAKNDAAKTKKTLRAMLDPISTLKKQIQTTKSNTSTTQKKFTAETSIFKQSIKNGHVSSTLKSLEALVTHIKKVIDYKQKMYSLEQQISEIERKVKLKIPLIPSTAR